jgi:hypothetical protein
MAGIRVAQVAETSPVIKKTRNKSGPSRRLPFTGRVHRTVALSANTDAAWQF